MISIIITCYNLESFISKAIESVLNQTDTNYELIVVDDCSTDNSLTIINSYKDKIAKVIINTCNKGIGYSKKIGAENSVGDHLLFLDGDDILESNAVEILNKYSNVELIISRVRETPYNIIHKFGSVLGADYTCFNSYCISRELFNRCNFSALRFYEDFANAAKLRYCSDSILYLKDILYNRTIHNQSATKTVSKEKELIYFCLALIENIEFCKKEKINNIVFSPSVLKTKYKALSNLNITYKEEFNQIKNYVSKL